jgi:hypothetical protein
MESIGEANKGDTPEELTKVELRYLVRLMEECSKQGVFAIEDFSTVGCIYAKVKRLAAEDLQS